LQGEFSPGAVDIGATVLQPLQVKNSKMPGSNDKSGFPVIEVKRDP
jgi:hypothetical protein